MQVRHKQLKTRRWTLGILVLLAVVCIWVGSSVLMQYIFTDADFNNPFFLTYFNTSMFNLYWLEYPIGYLRRHFFPKNVSGTNVDVDNDAEAVELAIFHKFPSDDDDDDNTDTTNDKEPDQQTEEVIIPMTTLQVAKTAAIFCPIWFAANWSFNASLSLTTVASNTVISSTSGLGTLVLGWLLKVDNFSVVKWVAVICSMGGVTLVSLTDSQDGQNYLKGDLLCLLSAACYSVYIVLLKKMIKDERALNMRFFFAFVGAINFAVMWPIAIILNYTGIEKFAFPAGSVFGFVLLNAIIGTVLSDYLWLLSVLLTTPLVATLGLSLTIPLAMAASIVLHGVSFTAMYFGGSVLVFLGFLMVNADEKIKALFSVGIQKIRGFAKI